VAGSPANPNAAADAPSESSTLGYDTSYFSNHAVAAAASSRWFTPIRITPRSR
jgi:hypothetical protein